MNLEPFAETIFRSTETTVEKYRIKRMILHIENSDDQDTIWLPAHVFEDTNEIHGWDIYDMHIRNSSDAQYVGARRLNASAADISSWRIFLRNVLYIVSYISSHIYRCLLQLDIRRKHKHSA